MNKNIKGLIVAGGLGTRLSPLTLFTNKHLLHVYDKPMIQYPLETMAEAGIKDIAIVSSGNFAGNFLQVIKNGKFLGFNSISYFFQEKPDGGIADAIKSAESFIKDSSVFIVLGDNVTDENFSEDIKNFNNGCQIFLKKVNNFKDYGCPVFNVNNNIIDIIEKPQLPINNHSYGIIGAYLFDNNLINYINNIKPSSRNQLEITDVIKQYIPNNNLSCREIFGYWKDCGTFETLFDANQYYFNKNYINR